jgi:beta-lactamase regulating signal transducer with metallopeptidase domain
MKMSLIVFGALAGSFFLRRRSAALRHWLLAAGVACAASLPIVTAVVPAWPLPFATPTAFTPYEDPFREAVSPASQPPRSGVTPSAPTPVLRSTPLSRLDGWAYVQAAWLAGAVTSLSILLIGLLRLSWLAVHARRIMDGRWNDLAGEIARSYGLRRPVTLLQSSHPSLLVTWGLVRPKVILPAAAAAWSDARARVVLSHELAHIRRGDWIVQLTAEVLRALYWFNPLLWMACRRLRLESEHACDDEVMRGGVEGADYATHLIELARALNQRRQTWFPAPAMARPSSLERRVRAMLNVQHDRGTISRSTRAAIFVLLFGVTTAVAAAQGAFATFSGLIADESGRGIPQVTVKLSNDARQSKYEVRTNGVGRFEFVGLPAGEYGLEVQGKGFRALSESLTLSGQNLQRNYTLTLGTLQETINVVDDGRDPRPSTIRERPAPPPVECTPSADGGRIVPPKKLRDFAPTYPASLRGTGTTATVQLKARIALDGYLTDIVTVEDVHPELASSAITAVREWMYTQTLLNCQPMSVGMTITVNYKPAPPLPPPPPAPRQ